MKRWCCTVAYDGTEFDGWQSQPSGNAIQDHIQKRLSTLIKKPVSIHGSGRTDAGVHARAQVFHVDLDWAHGSGALQRALNTGLPMTIRINSCRKTPEQSEFHARFSAKGKRYTYHICLGDPSPFETRFTHSLHGGAFDISAVNEASRIFVGTHDFTPFAARREAGVPIPDGVRTIHRLEWKATESNKIQMTVEGNGFLYKMVRSLVGTLIQVGLGRMSAETVKKILQSGERSPAVATAPAQGLFLDEVFYSEEFSA